MDKLLKRMKKVSKGIKRLKRAQKAYETRSFSIENCTYKVCHRRRKMF